MVACKLLTNIVIISILLFSFFLIMPSLPLRLEQSYASSTCTLLPNVEPIRGANMMMSNSSIAVMMDFQRDPSNPLMPYHTEPEVIKVNDTQYYMYYRNDSSDGHGASIGVMSSSDGLQWKETGIVLSSSKSENSIWDSSEVIAPSVLHDQDKYYLYYEAGSLSNDGARAIGVAHSKDPTGPFIKYRLHNPILTPTESWEGKIVGTPVVAKIGQIYYLFYHGYSQGQDRIGLAYSTLGPIGPWTKEGDNPILDVGLKNSWDQSKVAPSSLYVAQDNSTLLLFYEGFNGTDGMKQTSWRIGIASGSIDPLDGRIRNLTRYPNPVLDLGPYDSWDGNTVQLPSVISSGNELWMYYSGQNGKSFQLGRAVSGC